MIKHNPSNERIKRRYFVYLKEAKRQNEATVDGVAHALARFEKYNKYQDFKRFHFEQAVGFKKHLAAQKNAKSGDKLSKATLNSSLGHLKRFFQWLSDKPGYKSRLSYSDADYFNLSEKETRIANARRRKSVPTLQQIKRVLEIMPTDTNIALRNKAIVAFTILTGTRDSATASLKLKHIDLKDNFVNQDAREVNTKFSKTFNTFFFPVGDEIRQIVEEWVHHLRNTLLWGNDDPLFPKTEIQVGENRKFEALGLKREHWSNASPIRKIFKDAFSAANLPYYNPHSFRDTLVRLGMTIAKSPLQFKAWSQNLGHEGVLTSLYSYGEVPDEQQSEIIRSLSTDGKGNHTANEELANLIVEKLKKDTKD